MASALAIFGAVNQTITTASTTLYGGALNGSTDASDSKSTTEARVQGVVGVAGNISNLSVNCLTNSRTTDVIYGLKLNSSTILSVTYTSGQTGAKLDTTSAAIAADDLLSSFITTSTGSQNMNFTCGGYRFDASSGTAFSLGNTASTSGLTLSGSGPITDFIQVCGMLGNSTLAESAAQINVPLACTAKYLHMYVDTNGRSTDTVVTSRQNTAGGNQTFTYTSAQTGLKKDTSNTDTIAAGDKYCTQVALGTGTGNFIIAGSGVWATSSVNGESMTAAGRANGSGAGPATNYGQIGGRIAANTTEANDQGQMGTAATLSKLGVNIITNASTAAGTFDFRIGGASGNSAITLPTTPTTGFYEDSSHSDAFLATDLINWRLTGGATGAYTLSAVYAKFTTAVPATSIGATLRMMGVG